MQLMNQEEAIEFFKGLELKFSYYFKGKFFFEGEKEDKLISCVYTYCNPYEAEYYDTDKFTIDTEIEYFNASIHAGSDIEKAGKEFYQFELEY